MYCLLSINKKLKGISWGLLMPDEMNSEIVWNSYKEGKKRVAKLREEKDYLVFYNALKVAKEREEKLLGREEDFVETLEKAREENLLKDRDENFKKVFDTVKERDENVINLMMEKIPRVNQETGEIGDKRYRIIDLNIYSVFFKGLSFAREREKQQANYIEIKTKEERHEVPLKLKSKEESF